MKQEEIKKMKENEEKLFEQINEEFRVLQEQERLKEFDKKKEAIPAEPAEGTPNTVQVMIRLPNGNRISRRFHLKDTLQVGI